MTPTKYIGALAVALLAMVPATTLAQENAGSGASAGGTIEIGAGDVTSGSFKAGEYNGLEKKGAFLVGNLDLHGAHWAIKGVDLGLESRSLAASIAAQGKFRLSFRFDELLRNRSDSYQTPYDGAGTNVLTLPAAWRVPTVAGSSTTNTAVNNTSARGLDPTIGDAPYISTTNNPTMGSLLTPTAAQKALVDAAAAADDPLFHHVNLSTTRRKYDAAGGYSLGSAWDVSLDVNTEHKSGLKPMGTVSRNTGADIITAPVCRRSIVFHLPPIGNGASDA